MSSPEPSPVTRLLADLAGAVRNWVREHESELRAALQWHAVGEACRDNGLYAPPHAECWKAIEAGQLQLEEPDEDTSNVEALILKLYGVGGLGFDVLRAEIARADALRERSREVGQVLRAWQDGDDFLMICGALPLVEYVLSSAVGSWQQPHKLDLEEILGDYSDDHLSADDQVDLLLRTSAVEMVVNGVPKVWKPGPHKVGHESDELNRHGSVHGTALGWDTPANATRAAMLLASACVVAPLLADVSK
jgi:hypothetical protein